MHAVADGETAARNKTAKLRGVSHVRGGIGTASRTVGLLGAIFAYAMREDMCPDNPVRGVQRPADGRRDRRLSDAEYAARGAALRRAEGKTVWPAAVGVTRFLALTGWRKGEALALRWPDVDLVPPTLRRGEACGHCPTAPAMSCAGRAGEVTTRSQASRLRWLRATARKRR